MTCIVPIPHLFHVVFCAAHSYQIVHLAFYSGSIQVLLLFHKRCSNDLPVARTPSRMMVLYARNHRSHFRALVRQRSGKENATGGLAHKAPVAVNT